MELWVAGLPFIPQFLVILVSMAPVCFVIAYLLDRALRVTLHLLGRDRPPEPTVELPPLPYAAPAVAEPAPAAAAVVDDRRTAASGVR